MVFIPPDFSELKIEGNPVTSTAQRDLIIQSWKLVVTAKDTDKHPWVGVTISDLFFDTFYRLYPKAALLLRSPTSRAALVTSLFEQVVVNVNIMDQDSFRQLLEGVHKEVYADEGINADAYIPMMQALLIMVETRLGPQAFTDEMRAAWLTVLVFTGKVFIHAASGESISRKSLWAQLDPDGICTYPHKGFLSPLYSLRRHSASDVTKFVVEPSCVDAMADEMATQGGQVVSSTVKGARPSSMSRMRLNLSFDFLKDTCRLGSSKKFPSTPSSPTHQRKDQHDDIITRLYHGATSPVDSDWSVARPSTPPVESERRLVASRTQSGDDALDALRRTRVEEFQQQIPVSTCATPNPIINITEDLL